MCARCLFVGFIIFDMLFCRCFEFLGFLPLICWFANGRYRFSGVDCFVCVLHLILLCCDECLLGGLVNDVLWRCEAAVAHIQCSMLVVRDEESGLVVQRNDGVAVSENALDVAMMCLVEVVENSVTLQHVYEVTVGGDSSLHELGHDAELVLFLSDFSEVADCFSPSSSSMTASS